jgi:hypothetical protein
MPDETKSSQHDPLTATTEEDKVGLTDEELSRTVGGMGMAGEPQPETEARQHLHFTFGTVFTTKVG